jgi:oligopeptide/dipeptide ABC transporter ATP-binding protein
VDGLRARGPRYRRGVEYLLGTQAEDGTWHVRSRLHPPAPVSPPYFDAGYPHGHDQFISMQGASWAVMALAYVLDPVVIAPVPSIPGTAPDDVEPWVETMLFGTVDDVRRLLDEGLSPDAATRSGGTTALMLAAPDVAKMGLLLDRGASVNARARSRFTALMVAAQYQDGAPAIDLLLDRGAEVAGGTPPVFGASAFFLAAYAGNARSLPRLLEAGGALDGAMTLIGTLYASALHPYSRALLSSVPSLDPRTRKKRIVLEGDVPSPINPPRGCRFHPRCPLAMDVCRTDPPRELTLAGHMVRCHAVEQEATDGRDPHAISQAIARRMEEAVALRTAPSAAIPG